jgi:hypothetical protein
MNPKKHSTFNIQRSTSKGPWRVSFDIEGWALKVEGFDYLGNILPHV